MFNFSLYTYLVIFMRSANELGQGGLHLIDLIDSDYNGGNV